VHHVAPRLRGPVPGDQMFFFFYQLEKRFNKSTGGEAAVGLMDLRQEGNEKLHFFIVIEMCVFRIVCVMSVWVLQDVPGWILMPLQINVFLYHAMTKTPYANPSLTAL
jgi:hypothetical protein